MTCTKIKVAATFVVIVGLVCAGTTTLVTLAADRQSATPNGAAGSPPATVAFAGLPVDSNPLGPPDIKQAAGSSNQFGVDLYRRLAADDKKNLFFSPYSIESALAMTWAGARGATAQQMAQVLHFGQGGQVNLDMGALIASLNAAPKAAAKEPPFTLVTANALWAQKGLALEDAYQKMVGDSYAANLQALDFAGGPEALELSRHTINDWVAGKTNDKIKELIARRLLPANTLLVLTNAIYFKSAWSKQFTKSATRDEPFHLGGGSDATVPMMHQQDRMVYLDDADAQVLWIPYVKNRLSMLVVLPKKVDGLADVEKNLDFKKLQEWLKAAADERFPEVELSLPRFTFRWTFTLSQIFIKMGMGDAFSNGADFSGICTSAHLRISEVIHQAFIDVNEEGTEAAAATAVIMPTGPAPAHVEPIVFKADHPFLFFIQDNHSGAILFMGRVANPKS